MNPFTEFQNEKIAYQTRRHFLKQCSVGLGAMWFNSVTGRSFAAGSDHPVPNLRHHAPKAKRVIYLSMIGAPSQLELFDYKPDLYELGGKPIPQSYIEGKDFAFIVGTPKVMQPAVKFHENKKTGMMVSNLLPHFEEVIDEVTFIKSMYTQEINHAPAQLKLYTGNQNLGYPSIGAWASYGLGTENENLPGFICLTSNGNPDAGKSAWGSGFLPSVYQGVQCRSKGDPVLYLSNPEGIHRSQRQLSINAINKLNEQMYQEVGDPEIIARTKQYEMAFRMQVSATDAFDINSESEATREMYGVQPGKESFANNCLMARRLAERGVRFIQLFDWGWDHHSNLLNSMKRKCKEIDKPMTALLKDLKQRGLLEDTLVIWGGEFGRTPMAENRGGIELAPEKVGRDHHPDAFTIWMAGAGVKPGYVHGETDEIGFGVQKDPVHVHDLNATILDAMGFDHRHLTYNFQGLNQKLTGVGQDVKIINELFV